MSNLYATQLRDGGYDAVALTSPTSPVPALLAPKPVAPNTYPPPLHETRLTRSPSPITGDSSLPYPSETYAVSSRPSSSTGFLSPSAVMGIDGLLPLPSPKLESTSTPPLLQPRSGSTSGSSIGSEFAPTSPTSGSNSRRQSRSGSGFSFKKRDSTFSIPQQMMRLPSEETRVLSEAEQVQRAQRAQQRPTAPGANTRKPPPPSPPRGAVILYRLEEQKPEDTNTDELLPPSLPFGSRDGKRIRDSSSSYDTSSVRSTSRLSFMSGDSRLPLVAPSDRHPATGMQLVAYAYEPDALLDGEQDGEDDDWLHDPRVSFFAASPASAKEKQRAKSGYVEDVLSIRGLVNYAAIWLLLVGLVALFIFYPVVDQIENRAVVDIANNPNINSTGQATAR